MVIISSEICQQFIILRGFLHRALMLTLIIILWKCNRSDTKWYFSQEPDRFAGGRPFVKHLLSRDTALPVKPRLESSTLRLSLLSLPCLLFSLVYFHTALELPQGLFTAIHFTLYLCCILSSRQQVLSHPWGRTWEALMRHRWATGSGEQQAVVSNRQWWATGSGEQQAVVSNRKWWAPIKCTAVFHVINRGVSVILAWKMKLLSHRYLVHSQTVYAVLFIYMSVFVPIPYYSQMKRAS